MKSNWFRKKFTNIDDAFALAQAIVDTVHEPLLALGLAKTLCCTRSPR